MSGIAGYIDFNAATGEPYMGLMIEDNIIRTHIYLADKQHATQVVAMLSKALTELAKELEITEPKLMVVPGGNDGVFRKR